MTINGKVVSRKITQISNSLLFDIEVTTPSAKAGEAATVKQFKAQLTMGQLQTYAALGEVAPKVGDSVRIEQSVNPTTGEISKDWVTLCV